MDAARQVRPARLRASSDPSLDHPGLYAWWVDPAGAAHLQEGLGEPVTAGLIYRTDAPELNDWMDRHLRVSWWPTNEPDLLHAVES